MAQHTHRPVARYSQLSTARPARRAVAPAPPKSLPVGTLALGNYNVTQLGELLETIDAQAPSTAKADLHDLAAAANLVVDAINRRWEEGPAVTAGLDAVTRHLHQIVPRGQPFPEIEIIEASCLQASLAYARFLGGDGEKLPPPEAKLLRVTARLVQEMTDDELGWVLRHEWGHLATDMAPAVIRAKRSFETLENRTAKGSWLLRLTGPAHLRTAHVVSRKGFTLATTRLTEMLADQWATPDPQTADAGRRALAKLADEFAILLPKLSAAGVRVTPDFVERSSSHPNYSVRSAIVARAGGLGA